MRFYFRSLRFRKESGRGDEDNLREEGVSPRIFGLGEEGFRSVFWTFNNEISGSGKTHF